MTFDNGCAGSACHTDDKGFLDEGTLDVTVAELAPDSAPASSTPPSEGDDQQRIFSSLKHRDPWILSNAAAIRASLDPSGLNTERATLRAAVEWLQRPSFDRSLPPASIDELRLAQAALRDEIGMLDTPLAAQNKTSELEDLARARDAAAELLRRLNDATGQQSSSAESTSQFYEKRRVELRAALNGIRTRVAANGDVGLAARADALLKRVNQLEADRNAQSLPSLDHLRRALAALDPLFRAARGTTDAQVPSDLVVLQGLREYARGAAVGGSDESEFELRRREIDRLLTAISQSGLAGIKPAVDVLRARLLSLQPDSLTGNIFGARRKARLTLLQRINLEIELAGQAATAPPSSMREDPGTQDLLAEMTSSLDFLDRSAGVAPAAESERNAKQQTLTSLLAPCLKCHLFDGEDETKVYPATGSDPNGVATRSGIVRSTRVGLKLARVTTAERVLKRAVFSHAPHVTTTNCATCHGSVIDGRRDVSGSSASALLGSTAAVELNVPSVTQCQTCHTPTRARSDCATCHRYHPPSAGRLLSALWSTN